MKLIALTQGKFAQVDDADFEWLNQWKWHAWLHHGVWYAKRGVWNGKNMSNLLMSAALLGKRADHIDGDGLNNQRGNLRKASPSQQAINRRTFKNNASGIKGVRLHKENKKWFAELTCGGVVHRVGYFDEKSPAVEARRALEHKHFGDFLRKETV